MEAGWRDAPLALRDLPLSNLQELSKYHCDKEQEKNNSSLSLPSNL